MRRNPQDRMSNDSNNNNDDNDDDDDDDDTPSKLRRSPPSSVNQRSRYEIDHGSCDYITTNGSTNSATIAAAAATAAQNHIGNRIDNRIGNRSVIHHPISTNSGTSNDNDDNSVSNHGGSNSVGNYRIDIPLACGSPQQSPTTEGLHHRTRTKPVPTQQLSSSQAASSSRDHRQPYPHRTQRRSYNHNRTNGGGELALWRRAVQLFVTSILFGYCFFLYLAQNKNWGKEQRHQQFGNRPESHLLVKQESHRRPSSSLAKGRIRSDGRANDSGKKSKPGLDGRGRDSKSKKYGEDWKSNQRAKAETVRVSPSRSSLHRDYSFHAIELQQTYKEPATPAYQRALEWSHDRLQHARSATANRRTNRRRRTQPPIHPTATPLWYKLDYSSEGTISSIQQRWDDDGATHESESSLCGAHAQEAAKHHPPNYRSSKPPLGPQSRVLISGILSPLGLHLAIALHRQCKVANFMGLDSQMPNHPLSRLEAQERLAVLMGELENVRQLQVPFLGLEIKREKKTRKMRREERAREDRLMEWREWRERGNATESGFEFARPYEKYGIPLVPGANSNGQGALDAILEYRPTHIVHLAGTQSDSLLNSNYHAQNDDALSPGNTEVFQNKGEEEEDILKESIGFRPHLYDFRMGAVGMEQLLSGAVAQTMLPPRYGRANDKGEIETPAVGSVTKGELVKMQRPHVVYASSYDALYFRDVADRRRTLANSHGREEDERDNFHPGSPAPKRPPRGLHGASRLIDEILSSSYYALHGVSSVGLRFDAIYGPRGFGVPSNSVPVFHEKRKRRRGVSVDVDLAETAVRGLYRRWTDVVKEKKEREDQKDGEGAGGKRDEERQLTLIEEAGWMHLAHDRRDFVFVEDAIGAIIAAMQYRSVQSSPTAFNIGSGEMSPLSSLSDEIQELASEKREGKEITKIMAKSKNVIDVERSSAARAASIASNDYLRWSATTSLKDGAAKLLAWHLDRALPYFPPDSSASDEGEADYSIDLSGQSTASVPLDGEGILKRRGISSCSTAGDDPTCLREGHTLYPCASECATRSCTPSVFDGVISTTQDATEGCDVVMYTMSLGYDIEEMTLETDFSDGEAQEEWKESTVCTLAFVPSESRLVKAVIDQVPPNSLEDRGVSHRSDHKTKVEHLNGYLAHQGWVLILVGGATEPLSAEDMFLVKLSPARLFHSSVRKVMFVDENFSHTPLPDDAQFLASETSRGVFKKRTITGPDAKGKKTKYKLPEEPQRRAVLVVSPMRHIPDEDGHKMPLKEVTLSLMKELELDPEQDYSRDIRAQQEYYTRARSLVNSMDLRSLDSFSRHRLEIKDFIRSRWIVHHLKLEEGHQLRCEWYKEHARWNTHLDQMSFAYVMAKRELVRKIITRQELTLAIPTEELTLLQKIIQQVTDASEWHPIISAEGTTLPIHHSQIAPEAIPENLQDLPDHQISKINPDAAFSDVRSTYYVRIMSDPRMLESRKRWMKARSNHRKFVKQMKEADHNQNHKAEA